MIQIAVGKKDGNYAPYEYLVDSNTLLAIVNAICMFMLFKSLKIKHSKIINAIASTVFGVLMIHANSNAMRQWLWKDTLKNAEMFFSEYWLWHLIFSVLGVFAICSLIDMLRIKFIEKPFFKLWDKMIYKFNKRNSGKPTENA